MLTRVFFVREPRTGAIKVSQARNVKRRFAQLDAANPYPLRLLGTASASRYPKYWVSERLARHRIHSDWYEPVPEVNEFVHQLVAGRLEPPTRAELGGEEPIKMGKVVERIERDPDSSLSRVKRYERRRQRILSERPEPEYRPVTFEQAGPAARACLKRLGLLKAEDG